jgi:hypothetical protein
MTEFEAQNHLYTQLRRKRHEPVVPNVKLWRWECDLASVTQAGYAVEYEIKRTLGDFRRDRDKRRDRFFRGTSRFKHRGHGPCRFFYVATPGLDLSEGDLPDYAGLITLRVDGTPTRVMEAPHLREHTISPQCRDYLNRGLMCRYWDARTHDGPPAD